MKPLFTVHEGEFLVANHLEKQFGKQINIWVPSKDTGIDLLITDKMNRKAVSLQIKFSRDFLYTNGSSKDWNNYHCCGWWTLNENKISQSGADFWIFVLRSFAKEVSPNNENSRGDSLTQYVVIRPRELLRRLRLIHGSPNTLTTYLWVTKDRKKCFETRNLNHTARERLRVSSGTEINIRDYSQFLGSWQSVFDELAAR